MKKMTFKEAKELQRGDRLTCIHGFTHPNMGLIFSKGRKYHITAVRNYMSGDVDYAVGAIKEDGGFWLTSSQLRRMFIKEE